MVPPANQGNAKSKVSVAILEDNETLTKGMQLELEQADIHVCAQCTQVEDFLEKVKSCQPQIAIIDLRIWRDHEAGFSAIEGARGISPGTRFIVYSFYDQPEHFHRAINLGIKAFVTKNIQEISLDKVVRIVANGGTYYGDLLAQYLEKVKENPGALQAGRWGEPAEGSELSERELEVLRLLDAGRTPEEIARIRTISINTVKAHTRNIREKLGADTTVEALRRARLRGLL